MENHDAELKFAQKIVDSVNLLRNDASQYIKLLEQRANTYTGLAYSDSKGVCYRSHEGKEAVEEAIMEISSVGTLTEVKRVERLDVTAQEHCDYLVNSGNLSHYGENNLSFVKRLENHCSWSGKVVQILGSYCSSPEDFILQWLIDDSITAKNNRRALMNPSFKKIGAAFSSSHRKSGTVAVVILATEIGPRDVDLIPPRHHPELYYKLPDKLKELPPGAREMMVTRLTVKEYNKMKDTYKAVYTMFDGSTTTDVKDVFL
jgi:Cysteine-rich secretory protein family